MTLLTRPMTAAVTVGALVAGLFFVTPSLSGSAQGCNGKWRWPVKTMADPAAAQVAVAPKAVGFSDLMGLDRTPPPSLIGSTSRQRSVEFTTYRVQARLLAHKIEDDPRTGDRDFHIVIGDPARPPVAAVAEIDTRLGSTMVAEIPDPACSSGSRQLGQITAARRAYVTAHGQPGTSARLVPGQPIVMITGVGFFDDCTGGHHPIGHAPHCFELHPVLGMTPVR